MHGGYTRQFFDQVVRYIRQFDMFAPGELVVVAVSGGLDSTVLLHTLAALRQRFDLRLHCAHLNHQLRGAEAERDAEFVRGFAARLDIPCSVETRNVRDLIKQRKLAPQDAARQLRYEFLLALADRLGAARIATAHTADDQAETVLLGLIRGVGLRGLGGIQPVLNGRIIRPFLEITRRQIEGVAEQAGLAFVEDSSNASRKYVRNAVRLDLLPLLKTRFNPAIVEQLGVYARRFREDAECLEQIARARYDLICKNLPRRVKINLDLFAQECITIRRTLIYQSFEALTGRRDRLESTHVRAVLTLYAKTSSGRRTALPGGVWAYRDAEWGYLTTERASRRAPDRAEMCVQVPGITQFGPFRITIADAEARTPRTAPRALVHADTVWEQDVDADAVVLPLAVRFRRPGDTFQPLGMAGKKRVKKFFIDRKIPQQKRESIPIFEDVTGIVWIVGYSIDDRVKITPQTTRVWRCWVEIAGEQRTQPEYEVWQYERGVAG